MYVIAMDVKAYLSSNEMIDDFPEPEAPTRPANCPFSIFRLNPLNTGVLLVGYLKAMFSSSIDIPPSVSGISCEVETLSRGLLSLMFRIRFAAAEAIALFGPKPRACPAASLPFVIATVRCK